MDQPIGHWPPLPPACRLAAVVLDGGLASATAAAWLAHHGIAWIALVPTLDSSEGGRAASFAFAAHHARAAWPLAAQRSMVAAAGWGPAVAETLKHDADWLVLPLTAETGSGPLGLSLAAADAVVTQEGLAGLYVPLLRWRPHEVARLALALGVPFALTWDCEADTHCGTCAGCESRRKAFRQLGLKDPSGG